MDFSNPLLVFAMYEESQDVFDEYDVLHTGIGKVNATYNLMEALSTERPSIINMGTAGSRKYAGGSIVNCTSFIQRDMDVTPLGFAKYQTPLCDTPIKIEYGRAIDGMAQGVCGTGDNFDTTNEAANFDVVDMEAYALAYICQQQNIDFLCLKYISDSADGDADEDWNTALHRAAEALYTALKYAENQ